MKLKHSRGMCHHLNKNKRAYFVFLERSFFPLSYKLLCKHFYLSSTPSKSKLGCTVIFKWLTNYGLKCMLQCCCCTVNWEQVQHVLWDSLLCESKRQRKGCNNSTFCQLSILVEPMQKYSLIDWNNFAVLLWCNTINMYGIIVDLARRIKPSELNSNILLLRDDLS